MTAAGEHIAELFACETFDVLEVASPR